MIITLPKPKNSLNTNLRTHHYRRYVQEQDYALLVRAALAGKQVDFTPPVEVRYTYTYPTLAHWLDPDAEVGAAKPILDQIVRAGVLPDDNRKVIRRLVSEPARLDRGIREATLTIEIVSY